MPVITHPAEARRQFNELVSGEITHENLARGALLIALEEEPQLDVERSMAELDALVERVRARTSEREPDIFRLGHLHAQMFDADGFAGDSTNYYDVRNVCLNQVIDRRRGIPITLSIIFLHVASRIGLSVAGVGLPGHYIVKVQFHLNEIYVDPFHGGVTLSMPEIAEIVSRAGGDGRLTSEHLRAWNGRQTLMRVLLNLENIYMRMGERRKATAAHERMEMLQER